MTVNFHYDLFSPDSSVMKSKSNHFFLEPTLYTFISMLYLLRHILFGAFSLPGRTLYVLFFSWSLYYFVRVALEMKYPNYIKALNLLVGLILFYGVPLLLYGTDSSWVKNTESMYYLNIHMESILPIYSFYYFGKKRLIDDNWFRIIAVLYFVSVYSLYDYNRIIKLIELKKENVINNKAYLWLSLFPIMVFFNKKFLVQYIGIVLIFFYVLLGYKRGAIIIGAVCLLVFLWQSMQTSKVYSKIVIVLLVGILLPIIIPIIENLIENNELFASRLESTLEGNSSERDAIYSKYWSYYLNQDSFLACLFGNGAFGTVKLFGIMAHNDWLEFLIDMGLVGTLVYLIYWIQAIMMCKKSARVCRPEVYQGFLFFIIINLGRTVFSMSIMDMSFFATSVFGYLVAQYDNYTNNERLLS